MRSTSIITTMAMMMSDSTMLPSVSSVTIKIANTTQVSPRRSHIKASQERTNESEANGDPSNVLDVEVLLEEDVEDRVREHVEAKVRLDLVCEVVRRLKGNDEVFLSIEHRVDTAEANEEFKQMRHVGGDDAL